MMLALLLLISAVSGYMAGLLVGLAGWTVFVRGALTAPHLGHYMRRWIWTTPVGTLRLHNILRSDNDRHLHDHPWDYWSLLIRGEYIEHQAHGARVHRRAPSLAFRRAETAHRLEVIRPAWTIVSTGPRRREWGFWTEYSVMRRSWVHHEHYADGIADVGGA